MPDGIRVAGLTKTYKGGTVRALDGVSLAIEPGEIFGVIGPNGAGKTTLMGCLLGFLFPDSGEIAIDGLPPDDLAVKARIGYLPERLAFDRWMTGRSFLAYHHALAGRPSLLRADEVRYALERVGLDEAAARMTIKKYSRGMLQRIGLAQALIGEPKFLFLDEPTSGMDPVGAAMVRELLTGLRAAGATIIVNSHQLEQVERICDRVAFVKAGRVESVDVLRPTGKTGRILLVRIPGASLSRLAGRKRLEAAAKRAGAALVGVDGAAVRFQVADDRMAARLLAALVKARLPVVEAAPDHGRLERLFIQDRGSA